MRIDKVKRLVQKELVTKALGASYAALIVFAMLAVASAEDKPSQPVHDFMINNSPLKAEELRAAFSGKTHDGFYRFERESIPTHSFSETTTADGRVTHIQGPETITGTWRIKGDQICYTYDDTWRRELCFDMYRVGNCYYHYIMTEAGRPIQAWTARSHPRGEQPDCDAQIS